MSDTIENDRQPADDAALMDRRRPGRANYDNADLIALLRHDVRTSADPATRAMDVVPEELPVGLDLDAARGTVIGLSLAIPMWAVIIFVFWHFL